MKKKLLISGMILGALVLLVLGAAVPFSSFTPSQFGTNNNNVSIKAGSLLTNVFHYDNQGNQYWFTNGSLVYNGGAGQIGNSLDEWNGFFATLFLNGTNITNFFGGSSLYNTNQMQSNASSLVQIKSGALMTNPVSLFPTNFGVLVMKTNSTSTNQSYIEFPSGTHSGLYWPGGTFAIFAQYDHIGSPNSQEFGFVSGGDIALATGIGGQGGKIQMGGSGYPGTYTQIQYSDDKSSFLTFRGFDFGVSDFREFGMRLETTNRNGNAAMIFYNPLPTISGIPPVWSGGTPQFAILTNGVELNYRFTRLLSNASGTTLTMDFKGAGRVTSHPAAAMTVLIAPISLFTNMVTRLSLAIYPDFGSIALTFPTTSGPTNIMWRSESGIAVAPTNITVSNALFIEADLEVSSITNVIFHYTTAPYSFSLDASASAFFTASGVSDAPTKSAINQFCVSAKAHGYFTKLIAFWPFVGGTSNTHSWNLIDTTKYRIGWTGGFTFNANSVTGNGTTGYATATGLIPSTEITSQNDCFAGAWVKSTTPTGNFFGVVGGNSARWGMGQGAGFIGNGGMNANVNNECTIATSGDSSGFTGQNRTGSTTEQDYAKSATGCSTTGRTATSGLPTTTPFTMFARRFSDLSQDSYSNAEMNGGAVGQTMTAQNITDLITDWAALNTALGR